MVNRPLVEFTLIRMGFGGNLKSMGWGDSNDDDGGELWHALRFIYWYWYWYCLLELLCTQCKFTFKC